MYKQVIFDCDGVIVDTEIVAAEVMTNAFTKYNINIEVNDYIRRYTGKIITSIFESLIPPQELKNIDIAAFSNQCDVDIYNQLRPVKGMKDVILNLSMPLAVVSNSRLWQVKKAIKHVSLEGIFHDNLFSSEMVTRPKPWPDLYLHAAIALGVEPKECIVIEDSESGVKAAVSAGMTVIGFTGASHILDGHAERLKELGVKAIASTPIELKAIITGLYDR